MSSSILAILLSNQVIIKFMINQVVIKFMIKLNDYLIAEKGLFLIKSDISACSLKIFFLAFRKVFQSPHARLGPRYFSISLWWGRNFFVFVWMV